MKRILIVADEPGWIFERHSREIQKRLTEYHIDIVYHRYNIPSVANNYDLIYILDPMPLPHGYPPAEKTIMGLRCEFLFREHPQGAKGLYEEGFPGRCVSIKDKCCIFHVVNKNQMSVFKDIVTDKPLMLAQHGIDENVFNRFKYPETSLNDILTVGATGRDSHNKAFWIIKESCNRIGAKFVSAQYRNKLIKDDMPDFYRQMDVYVCTSETEGLHNGTMEAGAMGIPVITTRCGAAEEIIQDGVSGLFIDRNVNSLAEALEKIQSKEYRIALSDHLTAEIFNNWTWAVRIEDFRKMFNKFFGG